METYTATQLIPLYNLKTEWECRVHMIHQAKQFLYASTYFIQHDRYGREYVEVLLGARQRGVSVTLLIDAFGQILARNLMSKDEVKDLRKALARLTDSGAHVVFYRCCTPLKRYLGSGMHIKIQLSDKGGALFSSGNVSATSYDKWREFSVYVEGNIVCRLLEEFVALGSSVSPAHFQQLQARCLNIPSQYSIGYISCNPVHDPHFLNPLLLSHPNPITDYLTSIFANAKTSIRLTSFYFKPVPMLTQALVDAAKRGVAVEIFHSHRDVLPTAVPWMPSFHTYEALLDAGVHIYENVRGEHSKIIIIDEKTAVFGSYNLEYAAHDRMAEAMMVSEDPNMLETINRIFEDLRNSSDNLKVDAAMLADLPANLRRRIKIMKPLARWL